MLALKIERVIEFQDESLASLIDCFPSYPLWLGIIIIIIIGYGGIEKGNECPNDIGIEVNNACDTGNTNDTINTSQNESIMYPVPLKKKKVQTKNVIVHSCHYVYVYISIHMYMCVYVYIYRCSRMTTYRSISVINKHHQWMAGAALFRYLISEDN